jgi:GalNAc-alpha-(1->4)-GalNAc-alpha-(1->3)-diNAcBac-PP-undecaprenol alpha-1,4-N-acetyl-D-galactosaminyltransferase
MRITLAISSMGCGGAERVMATLANRWAGKGQSVTLLTLSAAADDFYHLNPSIARIGLKLMKPSRGAAHALLANARRVTALRRAIASTTPDVVVSFMDTMNVLTLCATVGLGVPVVVSERIDPTAWTPGRLWSRLRRVTYGRASGIVMQTSRAAEWAREQDWSVLVTVIANPIDARFLAPLNDGDARTRTVVGIGRLTAQKRFDRLIDAFDRVATKHPGWSLVIAGEGPLRGELADRMSRSDSASRMRLCGRVQDVASLLRGSRIFVLSSAFEGFPNALHEAMACGCAAIATDCPSGPSDMVANGLTGLLVPQSVDSISQALDELMGDESLCRALGSNAHRAAGTCSTEAIGGRWDALIDSLRRIEGAADVRAHA